MSAKFNTEPRFSPAGVTTAAVLAVIVAMAVSTLMPTETPQSSGLAASSSTQVAQAHHAQPGKKS